MSASRNRSALAAGVLCLSLHGGLATAQDSETAYVTVEGKGAISAVDAGALEILQTIDVGGRPHNIEATADGLLVVATQGTNSVAVVDPGTEPATVRRIPIGAPPHDLAVAADGRTVFVVSERGLLVRLDPKSGRLLQRTELMGRPHNLTIWRETAWITDVSARRVFVVDGDRVLERPISIEGHDLAVRPGSEELWITPWNSNRMVVIDLESRTETADLPVGRTPSHKHLAFTPDGRQAWVTEPASGSLLVVDARTRKLIQRVALEGHPHHVRMSGERAYVAVGPDHLVVLDQESRSIVGRLPVGADVHDVALGPAK
jgi:DNA-binding beta-propeller fold protein YncE